MFIQQYPTRVRDDRSSSQPARSQGLSATGQRLTRERSTSSSDVRDQYTKRSSIFSKRPKSILTTASHASSTRSHASSSSGSDISWRSSGIDTSPAHAEAEGSKARFLFGRGRKSKPATSRSFRASSLLEVDGEFEAHGEDSERERITPVKGVRISAPFGFQHIAKIEGNPSTISEENVEVFQNFRTLPKGHRHAVIAPSPEIEEFTAEATQGQKRPPPLRPQRPDDLWSDQPVSAPLPHDFQRASHAYLDEFEQPVSAGIPGYRSNSLRRSAQRSTPSLSQVYSYGPGPEVDTETGMPSLEPLDEYEAFVPLYDHQPAGWIESSVPLLQPMAPLDPFPDHLRAPTFSLPLEQVPEEPEGGFSNRPSKELPRRPSLRHSKSSPAIANRHKPSVDPFSEDEPPLPSMPKRLTRPLSQCSQSSDTLGDPLHSLWQEARDARAADVPSPKQAPTDELTWEDDIEYCYEHNAEADCDFNWQDVTHFDDNDSDAQSWTGQHSSYDPSLQPSREDSQSMMSSASNDLFQMSEKPHRVPSNSSVPELDYRYSHATSTASLSIATPRDGSLYRGSEPLPPLPVDIYTSKDMQAQQAENYMHHSHDSAYNEIMIARNIGASMQNLSHYEEDRPQTILFTGENTNVGNRGALPTPPQSGRQPAFDSAAHKHGNKSVDNLIVNEASRLPLPESPTPSSHENEEAPQLVSRSYVAVQNAAKLRLFEAQSKLSNLAPTSMPRNTSTESFDTGIQFTKLPTPPKTPSPADIANTRSFLTTPSPSLAPIPSPMAATPRQPSPVDIAPSSAYLPPLSKISSAPQSASQPRYRAESAAGRIGVLPSPSTSSLDKPGTPDSATSAPEGLGRKAYTLFPSHKSSTSAEMRMAVSVPSLASAPTSAPSVRSVSSSNRPPSLAPSQSSRTSSQPESRGTPKSKSKSKSSKKGNAYKDRYPLGI